MRTSEAAYFCLCSMWAAEMPFGPQKQMALLKPTDARGGCVWPLQASEKPSEKRDMEIGASFQNQFQLTETADMGCTDMPPSSIAFKGAFVAVDNSLASEAFCKMATYRTIVQLLVS